VEARLKVWGLKSEEQGDHAVLAETGKAVLKKTLVNGHDRR